MSLDVIGTYRDRPVRLQEVSSLGEMTARDLSHALVLLWLGEKSWDPEQLGLAIRQLAASNVLSVTVAGEKSDDAFSLLLQTLGSLPMRRHIITGIIKDADVKDPAEDSLIVKDAVEEFLIGTWPDEERFDDWTEYRIILIGKPGLAQQVCHAVVEMAGKAEEGSKSTLP